MKEIKSMKKVNEIIKKFPQDKWTSLTTKNNTGSYGYDEIISNSGIPVFKIIVDSARQFGKVYYLVDNSSK